MCLHYLLPLQAQSAQVLADFQKMVAAASKRVDALMAEDKAADKQFKKEFGESESADYLMKLYKASMVCGVLC